MTLAERIARVAYCADHGMRMPHYRADGYPCAPDSPEAQARARAVAPSPFARRALRGELPAKGLR